MILFLLKTVNACFFFCVSAWSAHKSAVKTFDDRFASCENIVWISFERMHGKELLLFTVTPFFPEDTLQTYPTDNTLAV